ncbi:MAG TPA: carbamoyltransferase HypF [Gemmatimonadales bacterium]|nr:carbamoyltransferase HypF [Gemmatimonadales bacterium]
MTSACTIRVRGVVQGVGFRPFVYRLARANTLAGWVLNGDEGVEIRLEGEHERLEAFLRELRAEAPAASSITAIDVDAAEPSGLDDFIIRASHGRDQPTAAISPDLALCAQCLHELFDPADPRYRYPYINCTDCGPRYSIILRLPYDRAATTMAAWPMDALCAGEYHDPASRRFHAQPVACGACGPEFRLGMLDGSAFTSEDSLDPIPRAARLLRAGAILAVKGVGGYHLACDARNPDAVAALRNRKFRKEKPFALMVRTLELARTLVELSPAAEAALASPAAPIVLAPGRVTLPHVAPGTGELGVMLPYAPLHHLLFAAGAPELLVMTSANRSSEPIAYEDADARERLARLADGLLVGQRPIARRVEDSVVRCGPSGPVILRRSRGYAPGAVAELPVARPVLALGADLKNAITIVVGGQAFVSQHIGDLDHHAACRALEETIHDLLAMYAVPREELLVVRDAHPQYRSAAFAAIAAEEAVVQHHRAHVASVLAERGAWEQRVLGLSLDGTGYGDDGTIWGGELFVGGVREGLERVAHLRPAALVGGDAAARYPVQAAVGFLHQLEDLPDLAAAPFDFPARYGASRRLLRTGTRVFSTTSAGRLFDAAAGLLGFTGEVTFEGQAAIWLEQLARGAPEAAGYHCPFDGAELDWRPLLRGVVEDRLHGRDPREIARAFHLGLASGLRDAAVALCRAHGLDTVVASGGVLQNTVLLDDLAILLGREHLALWINHQVPPNDGGISLGQAALGALGPCTSSRSR